MEAGVEIEVLMERYVDGDKAAFDKLVVLIEPRIRGSLRKWLRSQADVEDALQTALLKVHRNRHLYQRGRPVLPWIMTIARHVALDELRRPHRRGQGMEVSEMQQIPAPPAAEPWAEEDTRAVIEAVREAVDGLPPSSREVVRMHKLEGRSMAEIAELLGIKEGAVRVRAHRGYKALAQRLLGVWQARME
ncbi:MAG: RNA polymerase sigma factor [Myxococcota bacterium]